MNITERQIRGLQHQSSTPYTVVENGEPKMHYTATSRPLAIEDVLGTRETAEGISFVTTDGKKYFWDRKAGKASEIKN
jgi:hypothetical protein